MKRRLLFLIFILISTCSFADNVRGLVLDENGQPVFGASVWMKEVKGIGAMTGQDGRFELNVPDINEGYLIVSYVGYKNYRYALNGKDDIVIRLKVDATALEEVVVVGYGSMKKSDLTGSVVSVKTSDSEAAVATSFDKMLQGKAPGVTVSTGSAAPGGSVSVRIRGTSSLRGNNTPLYVVDGVIVSDLGDVANPVAEGVGGGNSRAEGQDPLSFISPQDIASIEILKDASATAIYGSQGANGVVLITTRQGLSAKPNVMISTNVTLSKMSRMIHVLDAYDYVDYYNSFLDEGDTKLSLDGRTPVNWQKESTRLAVSQNHRASLSGKSGKTSYFLALGYTDQQGVIRKTNVKKYDVRMNFKQDIGKYLTLSSQTLYSSVKTAMTSGTDKLANTRSSIVRHMISFKPFKGGDDDMLEGYDEHLTTPEAWFTDYDDDSKDNMFNTNLTLDIKPLKWLTVRLNGNLIARNKERSMWFGPMTFVGAQAKGKAGISNVTTSAYNLEGLLLFNHKFNRKHHLNGTLGVVYNNKGIKRSTITGEDFFSSELRSDGISMAAMQYPYQFAKVGEQLFSVLARAVYNYDSRYIATLTFRADGSSKFSKENRFSFFPSFALAWRIDKEPWMRNVDCISNMKLRAGWGQVGNQAIDPYQTLGSYNNNQAAKPDGSAEPGLLPARIPNPELKWETSEQYNIGYDLGFFGQRLTMSLDAYLKNTKDLLQEISIPYASGYASMWINKGRIENKGIELSLNGTPIDQNGWVWSIGGNISFLKNTIKYLGIAPSDFGMVHGVSGYWGSNVGNNTFTKFPANAFLEGHSIGLFMGYETDGILQEDVYNAPDYKKLKMNGKEIVPGDVLYVDQNNDGVVDDKDRVILGNPNPDFTYALNTSVSWKNLTLDMAFNGVYGNKIVNANLIDETDVKDKYNNVRYEAYHQAWTPENKSNTYPRLGYQPQGVLCDRIVEDGSYFKMSYLSLSYMLEFEKCKSVRNLTFNFTATNLFTISKYSGYDPDVNTFVNDTDRIGIDMVSYPSARTFTFGIIANF